MVTSVISAGDAANLGVQTTGGNDGVLVLRSGAAGAKVDALSIAASGTATFVGEVAGVSAINSGQIGGRRNILYNGEMKVAQRGASATGLGAGAGYFTLDRWQINVGSTAGRFTMAQVADGPAGFANSMKFSTTTADTSIAAGELLILRQLLEGQDLQQLKKGTASSEQVTVSFWVKGNASATYVCELEDYDNSRVIGQSFAVTTSWNRIELTFAADTSDPLNDDNALSFAVNFWLHAGSTYAGGTFSSNTWADTVQANRAAGISSIFDADSRTLFLTGVQMEIGATATEFESSTYGDELALCQRYCVVYSNAPLAVGQGYFATAGDVHVPFPVEMRTAPSMVVADATDFNTFTAAGGSITLTALALAVITPSSGLLRVTTASGLAAGQAMQLRPLNTDAKITFSAEL
mgnify:FL=1